MKCNICGMDYSSPSLGGQFFRYGLGKWRKAKHVLFNQPPEDI